MTHNAPQEAVTVALTGASGAQYAMRLVECLLEADRTVYLLVSKAAHVVIATEMGLKLPGQAAAMEEFLWEYFGTDGEQLRVFGKEDWFAPPASGSSSPSSMVICPCSTGTLSAIACGASDNLIERAADVALKERRQLILVPREAPYSEVHLENMLKLTRMGALVLPASPGFYHQPQTIDDLIDFVVARILDHLGVTHTLIARWGGVTGMSGQKPAINWDIHPAAIWRSKRQYLRPVSRIDTIRFADLLGVDQQKQKLVLNTRRYLQGLPANNVLLWGSRGTGKSSLIKALLNEFFEQGLRLIEIDKDDLLDLPEIVDEIKDTSHRFIVFCDDLSFERGESTYKALKSVLEGSIELPPENILIYATSNRRHLLPEYMKDNEQAAIVGGEIHHAEAVEEQISLSDRFGLWLSFYPVNQPGYLEMIDQLFPEVTDRKELHLEAIRFATGKGVRSGRTAQQFYRMYSGDMSMPFYGVSGEGN